MIRLLAEMLRWFPDRRFVFGGDSAYGTHEVARFVDRHRKRICLVRELHPEANLFEPPPAYRGKGRPAVKGARLPKPREAVSAVRRFRRHTVAWYGGGMRRVGTQDATAHWFKSGKGLVAIRWVFVRDRQGTHRDEYFYTTDPALSVGELIGYYTGRWNIETTFEEVRSCLLWGAAKTDPSERVLTLTSLPITCPRSSAGPPRADSARVDCGLRLGPRPHPASGTDRSSASRGAGNSPP
jgi:hypothetical protein